MPNSIDLNDKENLSESCKPIKNADMILVMRDGDIMESGNHEELLAKDGFTRSFIIASLSRRRRE